MKTVLYKLLINSSHNAEINYRLRYVFILALRLKFVWFLINIKLWQNAVTFGAEWSVWSNSGLHSQLVLHRDLQSKMRWQIKVKNYFAQLSFNNFVQSWPTMSKGTQFYLIVSWYDITKSLVPIMLPVRLARLLHCHLNTVQESYINSIKKRGKRKIKNFFHNLKIQSWVYYTI